MSENIISEYDAEVMFDEYLDETYEKVNMFGSTFYPSQILNKCDPIAYDIGLSEFIDHLAESSDIYVDGITDHLAELDEQD
jgi:hypothetical protein